MPVPKRKRSRQRRDTRFANKGLSVSAFNACSNCQAIVVPHSLCKECGFYGGRKVATTKAERAIKRADASTLKMAKQAEASSTQE